VVSEDIEEAITDVVAEQMRTFGSAGQI